LFIFAKARIDPTKDGVLSELTERHNFFVLGSGCEITIEMEKFVLRY